jgi:hypothetical protein
MLRGQISQNKGVELLIYQDKAKQNESQHEAKNIP